MWRPRNAAITTHETGPVPCNPVILITPSPGPASLSHSRPPCTDSSSRTSRATLRYQILKGNGLRIDHKTRCAAKVWGGGLGQCQEAGQHRLAHLLHPPGDGPVCQGGGNITVVARCTRSSSSARLPRKPSPPSDVTRMSSLRGWDFSL